MDATASAGLSSTDKSRKGLLLFRPGDVAATGPTGNAETTGVIGTLLTPDEEFLTRNGLVSESSGSDFGILREGVESSKGETTSI
jgi:hypothetical protein